MGVNLTIILSHSLTAADLIALSERVRQSARMQNAAEQLWHVMRSRWSNLGPLSEFAELVADEGLSVSEVQAAWRVADVTRLRWAGFSLYFGEQAVEGAHEGVALADILETARLKCGEPAGSIRDMADEDEELNPDSRCYFVEWLNAEDPQNEGA